MDSGLRRNDGRGARYDGRGARYDGGGARYDGGGARYDGREAGNDGKINHPIGNATILSSKLTHQTGRVMMTAGAVRNDTRLGVLSTYVSYTGWGMRPVRKTLF